MGNLNGNVVMALLLGRLATWPEETRLWQVTPTWPGFPLLPEFLRGSLLPNSRAPEREWGLNQPSQRPAWTASKGRRGRLTTDCKKSSSHWTWWWDFPHDGLPSSSTLLRIEGQMLTEVRHGAWLVKYSNVYANGFYSLVQTEAYTQQEILHQHKPFHSSVTPVQCWSQRWTAVPFRHLTFVALGKVI